MTDNPTTPTRRSTKAAIRRKSVYLTDQARADVQQWANENGVTFSAAIETLALAGLDKPVAQVLTPVMVSAVRQAILQEFNRFGKLAAFAAIEAGSAANMAGAAFRQMVISLAAANPKTFQDRILYDDPDTPAEKIYWRVRREARADAVRKLRQPLDLTGLTPNKETQAK